MDTGSISYVELHNMEQQPQEPPQRSSELRTNPDSAERAPDAACAACASQTATHHEFVNAASAVERTERQAD